ncbi:Heat shock protein 70 family [Penicillium angulare]|uniref:Heat shock protein 70 family n=1 Tax=Penicillium angulare TaxID=116970 RepID=UPI002540EB37|nr:Heat shock protein 70 family [Penicillium angulare]KAJ5261133.1 Heat shock protein 70 family [Penicillium angulare]
MVIKEDKASLSRGERTRLSVGIDFGTTFSGIGWKLQGSDEIEVVQDWPAGGNGTSQKVPTLISYNGNKTLWGYQVDDMKECIRGVKVLLDRSQDIQYDPAVESDDLLRKLEKKPVQVTADYLKKLISHLQDILDRRGIGCLMKTMDVHYTVTVPAELGALCGSTTLDNSFQKFLMETIGEMNYMSLSEESKRMAMHRWINDIKPYFAGQDDDDGYLDGGYFVPVAGVQDSPKMHIKNGMLHLDSDQVQKIFDPVVSRIKELIASQNLDATQVGSPPKAVILVGGLGSSEYLYKQLKGHFRYMEIMQPLNAWSAVVRGAIDRGLEGNQIASRRARSHYGTVCSMKYDPATDSEQNKEWDHLEEFWRVDNQMSWFIEKVTWSVNCSQYVLTINSLELTGIVSLKGSRVFHDKLMFCIKDTAPRFESSESVFKLCEVVADLSKVPEGLLEKKKNSSGQEYYIINYKLVLTPLSASLLFDLEFNGMSYGTVRANYY